MYILYVQSCADHIQEKCNRDVGLYLIYDEVLTVCGSELRVFQDDL